MGPHATYQLSKYLTNVLKPLTDESRHKLQSTENFIDAIKTIQIPDDHKLVSFDVKSLFTSIPLQLALDCTENATVELPLPTDGIMYLLNLCLTSTYFQYNGEHYKQLHGTVMGSSVSVVVAEIVMQNIEEQVLATYLLRPLSSIVAKGEELRNRRNEVKERIRKKNKQTNKKTKQNSSCTLSFCNIYFVLLSWAR